MIRFAITDRKLYPGSEKEQQAAVVAQAVRLAASGVHFLQVREKDLSANALVTLVRRIIQATHENHQLAPATSETDVTASGAKPHMSVATEARQQPVSSTKAKHSGETCAPPPMRILVNGDFEVATKAGADGVHLASTRIYGKQAAALIASHKDLFVSASAHTLQDVERARQLNVNAILYGPIFGKNVRGEDVQSGIGIEALREAVRAAEQTPVIALGGITAENAQACIDAGAVGIAGIRMFL